MSCLDDFRSNLLLLLHCRYPEGLMTSQLENEYKLYFDQDVTPNLSMKMITWEQIFQLPLFQEDFITYSIGHTQYIKANRKRSQLEMSLIAKVARKSNLDAALKSELESLGAQGQAIYCLEGGHPIIHSYPEPVAMVIEIDSDGFPTRVIQQETQRQGGTLRNSQPVTLAAPTFPTPPLAIPQSTVEPKPKALPRAKVRIASADTTVSPKSEPEVFKCTTTGCDQVFSDKPLRVQHERVCEKKAYPCTSPGCKRRFLSSKQRHGHVSGMHQRQAPTLKCSVPGCYALFRTEDKRRIHESRCRFKYETFQELDKQAAILLKEEEDERTVLDEIQGNIMKTNCFYNFN